MGTLLLSIIKAIPWLIPFIKETLFGTKEQRSKLWIGVLLTFLLTTLIFVSSGMKIYDYTAKVYTEAIQYRIALEQSTIRVAVLEKTMDERQMTVKNLQVELSKASDTINRYQDRIREAYKEQILLEKKVNQLEDSLTHFSNMNNKNEKHKTLKDKAEHVK